MKYFYRLLSLFNIFLISCSQSVSPKETPLPNPAYVNIAPCSCDLTQNRYDNNCCCDPDSTSADKFVSNCLQGPLGGNFTFVNEEMCRLDSSYTADWFPFLCIEFNKSPNLGLYYPTRSIQGNIIFSGFTYQPPLTTTSEIPAKEFPPYSYGDAIKLGNSSQYISLPQKSLSGLCIGNAPVRYLIDTNTSCDVMVDSTKCQNGSQLDASRYWNMDSQVSYRCANASDPDNFVKTANSASTNLTQCTASPPTLTSSPPLCQNAVVSVSYIFTWNDTTITNISVVITLADVSLTSNTAGSISASANNVLAQKFSTSFVAAGFSDSIVRSGNPGYDFGLPVIIGVNVSGIVNTLQLQVWSPDSSGLCANSSLSVPGFGYDTLLGCSYIVQLDADCTTLRGIVQDHQRRLFTGDYVSRFGNPDNGTASGDWLNIVSNLANFNGTSSTQGICEGIPTFVEIEFFWAKTGDINGEPIHEIVGARTGEKYESWDIRCTNTSTNCTLRSYNLYSSVTFTEVPAQPQTSTTLYELSRNVSCNKDSTCWSQLLLPIQSDFVSQFDTVNAFLIQTYNFRWALAITFSSIVAVFIPFNWKTIGGWLMQKMPL